MMSEVSRALSTANVRIRGKIRHEEWPKITERFRKGETLTEIARSYRCTPPAIRYIVQRTERGETKRGKSAAPAAPAQLDGRRATAQVVSVEPRPFVGRHSASEIWDRVASDIASFLAGMDAISVHDSDQNYEALLLATDRLLRSSARTRLEVERVLESRKTGSRRRMP